ncbi:MAG: M24 family metallopeptidase [Anaerolineae bacterium]
MFETLKRKLLPLRQQAEIRNQWLKERLDTLLPELMARTRFDMWLVVAREYNEDPVIMTLLPEPSMSARRRTILVFYRKPDGTVERLTVSRYGQAGFYEAIWDPDKEDQFDCLARIIAERDPQSIGLNFSTLSAFGDGISHTEYERIWAALGETYQPRTCTAEHLAIGWLERRIPAEMAAYGSIVQMGHRLIAEAFSNHVIHPGITTTDDVVWWFRQTMHDLGVKAWFQPSVDIQAHGQSFAAFHTHQERRNVIMPGDLLWCDVGFYYLGLATDQQQHAYVLRPGETSAPEGLQAALSAANRLQDIHNAEMQVGRTGNEVLKAALERAQAEGLQSTIYSHPLGYHGHAAGPTIGLWDRQGGVPGAGDYHIFDDTAYSVELNNVYAVPEWDGQEVRIALEEDALLTGGQMQWLDGRQTTLHLIG